MFKTTLDTFSDGYIPKLSNPVSVIASFSASGELKPLYVRVIDKDGAQHDCKILRTLQVKREHYDGIWSMRFICTIQAGSCEQQISLLYLLESAMWGLDSMDY